MNLSQLLTLIWEMTLFTDILRAFLLQINGLGHACEATDIDSVAITGKAFEECKGMGPSEVGGPRLVPESF